MLKRVKDQGTPSLEIVSKSLKYDANSGTISRYVGNPDVGDYSDSGWRFYEAYKHMGIAVEASEIDVCRQEV